MLSSHRQNKTADVETWAQKGGKISAKSQQKIREENGKRTMKLGEILKTERENKG